MKITVTTEDIKNGLADSPCLCPIALAMKRAGFEFPPRLDNGVHPTQIYCSKDGRKLVLPTPDVAREFIYAFDEARDVEPFEFDLEVK